MFQFSSFLTVTSQKQQEAVFSFLMEHKKKHSSVHEENSSLKSCWRSKKAKRERVLNLKTSVSWKENKNKINCNCSGIN